MIVPSKFPILIWDGTSLTRLSRNSTDTPSGEDWDQISAEVIATQDFLKQFSDARESLIAGSDTLSSGSQTILTSQVGDSSIILITPTNNSGNVLSVDNIVAGVSFDVLSSDGSDTGTFNWLIVN